MIQMLTPAYYVPAYTVYRTNSFFTGNGFYIVMGLVCIIMGGWLLYTKAYKYSLIKKNCTVPVEARIYEIDSKYGGKGGRRYNFSYEFFFNEQRFVASNDIYEKIGMYWRRPHEGDVVTIFINPSDPHECYDIVLKGGRNTGIVAGILITAIGIFMQFMPLLIK